MGGAGMTGGGDGVLAWGWGDRGRRELWGLLGAFHPPPNLPPFRGEG